METNDVAEQVSHFAKQLTYRSYPTLKVARDATKTIIETLAGPDILLLDDDGWTRCNKCKDD